MVVQETAAVAVEEVVSDLAPVVQALHTQAGMHFAAALRSSPRPVPTRRDARDGWLG